MPRELITYPFSNSLRLKLSQSGYTDDSCFKDITPLALSRDASLSLDEALQVIKTIRGDDANKAVNIEKFSAHILAEKESLSSGIVTFSQKIDSMFGDGIPVGKITEFCGVPGIGKTQFCMQLCVDAVIPECFGGVQGQSIYIDTEGSFVAERVSQIATAAVNHCQFVASTTNDPDMTEELKHFDVEFILKSIHYFRCTSSIELIALSHQLPEFITSKCTNVKMIVVDSFAFHFRHGWNDMSNRTRVMNSLAQQFIKIASSLDTAVIFINQMTTKISSYDNKLVPALGESWSHIATNRVLLFWQGGQRFANLFKSSNRKEDTVPYCITIDGVRDVDDAQADDPAPCSKKVRHS